MEAHDLSLGPTSIASDRQERRRAAGLVAVVVSEPVVVAGLAIFFAALTALTWRRWGILDFDTGTELAIADRVSHGAVLYRDIRYFYGPAGLYSLALMFKLFGTGLGTAYAFGLIQTTALTAAFYALARVWVRPLTAGITTAGLLLLGYTGWANFVLPNSNSGTFGLLFLLLMVLAMAHRRMWLAGVCLGILGLTRVEFAGAGVVLGIAFLAGTWMVEDRAAAQRIAIRLALPAIIVAAPILAFFAARAGASNLITENLLPVHVLGAESKFQSSLSPFSVPAVVATAVRGLIYLTVLGGAVAGALMWPRLHGWQRLRAIVPLAAGGLGLLILDGASRVLHAFPGTRDLLQTGIQRGLISTTWLPALITGLVIVAAYRAVKRRPSLLSDSWPLDLALLAAACVLAFRAFNNFSADTYAPYYAAPLLILAAAFHERVAARWPGARPMVIGVFALGMASIAIPLTRGIMADNTQRVDTARGAYLASTAAAANEQATIDFIRSHTRPGQPILSLPYGGIYFSVDRPPALYNVTFLPGDVASPSDQRTAIAGLERKQVKLIALSNATFEQWGQPHIGVDYDRQLMAYITRTYRPLARFGNFADTSGGPVPQAYVIYQRR